jgi:hypothetical protein
MNSRDDSDKIETISDATRILKKLEKNQDRFLSTGWPFDRFPFGLWFRGQSFRENSLLEPCAFRPINRTVSGSNEIYSTRHDETNLYVHTKLRAANYQQTYRSAFDWLCLMQHYSIPTRLLDWSESILIALYFAVRDTSDIGIRTSAEIDDKTESEIVALNARALNYQAKGPTTHPEKKRPSIASPDSSEAVIRAEMAATRSLKNLKLNTSVKEAASCADIKLEDANWVERFRKPIAVFPSRLNDRMIFQSSVFTLHGGKYYVEGFESYYENDTIPEPITLEEINKTEYILQRYRIPSECKGEIRRDLFKLGIHEGTLFPELDRQAIYLKQLW